MVVLLLPVLVGFGIGLSRLGHWSAWPLPGLALAVGVYSTATEPADYDMQGFGLLIGGAIASAALLGWMLARGYKRLARYRSSTGRPEPSRADDPRAR